MSEREYLRTRLATVEREAANHRRAVLSYEAALATQPDDDERLYYETLRNLAQMQLEADEGKARLLRAVLAPATTTSTTTH